MPIVLAYAVRAQGHLIVAETQWPLLQDERIGMANQLLAASFLVDESEDPEQLKLLLPSRLHGLWCWHLNKREAAWLGRRLLQSFENAYQ
jgi:hypothetical protein